MIEGHGRGLLYHYFTGDCMGSHIQPETAENDIDFRIAKAIRHINIGTTPDVARVAGLPIQAITYRMGKLRKYRILAGDRTGYRPGPEFEDYFNFYSKRYEQGKA